MIVPVGIALGSNMGDRSAELDAGISFLRLLSMNHEVLESPRIETAPVDCPPGSPAFLNSVAEIEVDGGYVIARAAHGSLTAALNDGEDFELLFTIDPRQVTALRQKWARKFALELTEIGRVVRSRQKVTLIAVDGSRKLLAPAGYDHFATR